MRQTLMATFWLSAPLLTIGFIAGLVISLVQIATSMQDNAFSTIPRLVAFLVRRGFGGAEVRAVVEGLAS